MKHEIEWFLRKIEVFIFWQEAGNESMREMQEERSMSERLQAERRLHSAYEAYQPDFAPEWAAD